MNKLSIYDVTSEEFIDIVINTIKIKKSGKNYIADCSYCNGKECYTISPERKIMHCFGCGNSDNLYTFIKNMKNYIETDFYEILEKKYKEYEKE